MEYLIVYWWKLHLNSSLSYHIIIQWKYFLRSSCFLKIYDIICIICKGNKMKKLSLDDYRKLRRLVYRGANTLIFTQWRRNCRSPGSTI